MRRVFLPAVAVVLVAAVTVSARTATGAAGGTEQIAVSTLSGGIVLIDSAGRRLAVLTRPHGAGRADSDPAWSPDGTRLAFTRTTDGRRSFHVYVMRADGSALRRLTGGRFDERPAWSPDGRWIAYQSGSGLRVVHPDGTGSRILPYADRDGSWPAWTPDERFSYSTADGWVVTAATGAGSEKRVARGRDGRWSPDGRSVVYTRPDGGVATVPTTGGKPRPIGTGFEADWSPDSRRIVFTRWPGGSDFSIWLMNADGRERHRILQGALTPAWRPR